MKDQIKTLFQCPHGQPFPHVRVVTMLGPGMRQLGDPIAIIIQCIIISIAQARNYGSLATINCLPKQLLN